ncbi:hypothetical protein SDC9_186945 [bioreactor metagenome]|uniref:Uncharacterized protein n=1 Tax=bioreactor metagenome TaxID=1076179 RepID=A0A645HKA0_9ZZZZ
MVEEKLSVDVALRCRYGKPADGGILVLGDILSHQIQLAEGVLRMLIALFSGSRQKLQSHLNVLWRILAHEIKLAQSILRKLVSLTGRPF